MIPNNYGYSYPVYVGKRTVYCGSSNKLTKLESIPLDTSICVPTLFGDSYTLDSDERQIFRSNEINFRSFKLFYDEKFGFEVWFRNGTQIVKCALDFWYFQYNVGFYIVKFRSGYYYLIHSLNYEPNGIYDYYRDCVNLRVGMKSLVYTINVMLNNKVSFLVDNCLVFFFGTICFIFNKSDLSPLFVCLIDKLDKKIIDTSNILQVYNKDISKKIFLSNKM